MTTKDSKQRVADEVDVIRAEYADEEAEAAEAEVAEAEVAERNAALDVPLNLRIDRELDTQLRQRAVAAQIPVSALVRRLLREAMTHPDSAPLTVEQVERIARRVLTEAS
jgi:predicted HicB family RNase H-like nuclease